MTKQSCCQPSQRTSQRLAAIQASRLAVMPAVSWRGPGPPSRTVKRGIETRFNSMAKFAGRLRKKDDDAT